MRTITWICINGLLLSFMAQSVCFAQDQLFIDDMEMSDEELEDFYYRYQDELALLADQMDAEDDEVEEIEQEIEEDLEEDESPTEEEEESAEKEPAKEKEDEAAPEVEEKTESESTDKKEETKEEDDEAEEPTEKEETEKKEDKADKEKESEEKEDEGEEPAKEEKESEEKETKEQESEPEEEQEPELVGIDTVDLSDPAGNWLYKRIWWNNAQERYEKIKNVFDAILEMRMPFFQRRAKIDREVLEPFYVSAGLDQSELTEILAHIQTLLDTERKKDGSLGERERILLNKIEEDKKTLEQMQQDVAKLAQFDDALDEALNKLMEQVNAARNYEKQAWQAYKDIGKELNDNRARELYEGMQSQFNNINNIADYVRGVFKQHFTQVDTTIQEHADRIKESMQMLKEKGVDLKEQFNKLQQKTTEKQEREEQEEQEQEEEAEEQGGVLGFITSIWQSFKDTIFGVYNWITSFFIGESVEGDDAPQEEIETVEIDESETVEPANKDEEQ